MSDIRNKINNPIIPEKDLEDFRDMAELSFDLFTNCILNEVNNQEDLESIKEAIVAPMELLGGAGDGIVNEGIITDMDIIINHPKFKDVLGITPSDELHVLSGTCIPGERKDIINTQLPDIKCRYHYREHIKNEKERIKKETEERKAKEMPFDNLPKTIEELEDMVASGMVKITKF